MSIQFRSRIKSAADYSSVLSDIGVCCYPDGTDPDEVSYSVCTEGGGYFQYGDLVDISCPNISDTGCCCACSYVDDFQDYLNSIYEGSSSYLGGLQEDVSFCECSSIGGIWSPQSCSEIEGRGSSSENVFGLCTNGVSINPNVPNPIDYDVRFPQGCCVDSGAEQFECFNVCSSLECAEKQTDSNPDGTATHHPEQSCNDVDCGEVGYRKLKEEGGSSTLKDGVFVVDKNHSISLFRGDDPYRGFSACITENTCKMEMEDMCDGYWSGLTYRRGINMYDTFKCTDSEVETVQKFIRTKTVSRSEVNTWEVGDYKFGGYYLGEFHGRGGMEVSGNPDTGVSKKYITELNSKELKSFTNNKYAIITYPLMKWWKNFSSKTFKSVIPNEEIVKLHKFHNGKTKTSIKTSKNDSIYNMSNSFTLIDDIKREFNNNGFGSGFPWVIPSLSLSAFIYHTFQNNENIKNVLLKFEKFKRSPQGLHNWAYAVSSDMPMSPESSSWTSTIVPGTESNPLAYVQCFITGSVFVSPLNKKYSVRPVLAVKIVD